MPCEARGALFADACASSPVRPCGAKACWPSSAVQPARDCRKPVLRLLRLCVQRLHLPREPYRCSTWWSTPPEMPTLGERRRAGGARGAGHRGDQSRWSPNGPGRPSRNSPAHSRNYCSMARNRRRGADWARFYADSCVPKETSFVVESRRRIVSNAFMAVCGPPRKRSLHYETGPASRARGRREHTNRAARFQSIQQDEKNIS